MGGRGASSGTSKYGNPYGSQYRAVMDGDKPLVDGNIKFVRKNSRDSEPPMETMTDGRVYVQVGGDELVKVVYFDNENKRVKTIDLNHTHDGKAPHTHHGYEHNENDAIKGYANLTTEERAMVDRVVTIWEDYLRRR